MKNINYKNKKIALVPITDNMTAAANLVAENLKKAGAQPKVFESLVQYRDYYALSEFDPDITFFLDSGAEKLLKVSVKDCTTTKHRPTSKAYEVQKAFRHHLLMENVRSKLLGVYKIEWDAVRDIPWYWQDDKPMLYFSTKLAPERVSHVMLAGIKDYFKADRKMRERQEKETSHRCIHGCAER